jgi:hypothetical protein
VLVDRSSVPMKGWCSMPDLGDLEARFAALDQPQQTPPDVRDRIWNRVTTGDTSSSKHAVVSPVLVPDAEPGDVEVLDLFGQDGDRSPGRVNRWLAVAAGVVVILVSVGVLVALDDDELPVASGEFPTREAEAACNALTDASADFALFALDGVALPLVPELEELRAALDRWVELLEQRGLSRLDGWSSASQQLRQVILDVKTGETDRATSGFSGVRDNVFGAVDEADDPIVATCFGDWTDDPFIDAGTEIFNPDS